LAPLSANCKGDLGVAFFEVVGSAIPKKWQSVQKKGQAETCPYPQGHRGRDYSE